MKRKLTNNIGLKIVSVLFAFLLWLIVVNVDDPVISRTYSGIQVEILNDHLVAEEGKCYEVLGNTDVVNVVVTAKRSVLDVMSKDYIKATADFNALTFVDTVPIEVKSTRYADKIESVTTRTESLKVKLENVVEKQIGVEVSYDGNVKPEYVFASASKEFDSITISGPESVIDSISYGYAKIDLTDADLDAVIDANIDLYDSQSRIVEDARVKKSDDSIEVSLIINPTKEVQITSGYSGTPEAGYVATGTVITNPSSAIVSGRGENYDDMDVIYISPDVVNIDGARDSVEQTVDINDYLPTGVIFADSSFDSMVNVNVEIKKTLTKTISVPLSNITISNMPEGYIASVVDIGGAVDVEIQGLGDTFDRYSGDLAIGTIDALSLVPRNGAEINENSSVQIGENDGVVMFDLPNGISVTKPVTMYVIVDYIGDANGGEEHANAESETVNNHESPEANDDGQEEVAKNTEE